MAEQCSRHAMLVKLKNKKFDSAGLALIKKTQMLPNQFYKSLTRDLGGEMTNYQKLTLETAIQVKSCDPRSSW